MFGAPVLGSKRVVRPYERTIIVSDGNIGFAFLRRPPGYPGGIDHFGIEVDDLDTVFARMKERYPKVGWLNDPPTDPSRPTVLMTQGVIYLTSRSLVNRTSEAFGVRHSGSRIDTSSM
jgi:hypothetical protein